MLLREREKNIWRFEKTVFEQKCVAFSFPFAPLCDQRGVGRFYSAKGTRNKEICIRRCVGLID